MLRSVAIFALVPALSGFRAQEATRPNEMPDFEIAGVGLFECQCPAPHPSLDGQILPTPGNGREESRNVIERRVLAGVVVFGIVGIVSP